MNETTTEEATMFFNWLVSLKPYHAVRVLLALCLLFWAVAAGVAWQLV